MPDPAVNESLPDVQKSRCYRCEQLLPVSDFVKDRAKASGRASICKPCDREKARAYYAANRERVIARVTAQQRVARQEGRR